MAHTPGIGAAILSSWATRAALTPYPSATLATAMHRWFFATSSSVSTSNQFISGLARVTDGWTGEVIVSVDGSSYAVQVFARSSVSEVLERIVRAGSRRGGAWSWWIGADGAVTLFATVPFEVVLSGTTRDRLGLGGIYAGQYTYTGDPIDEAWLVVPSLGIGLAGAEGMSRGGGVTQSEVGAESATGLLDGEDSGTVRIYGTQSELVDLVTTLGGDTWDIALGGTKAARVRVQGVTRERWGNGTLRSTVLAQVTAVSR